jgi:hypothetical protein
MPVAVKMLGNSKLTRSGKALCRGEGSSKATQKSSEFTHT